jgi:hypothetical protein
VTETTTVGTSAGSLQGLIDAANDGDTIPVEPGLYVGGIDFKGMDITLESTDGPATTIIHGNSGTAVHMGPGGTITGFTITGASGYGSGIEVNGVGSVITGNIINGNSSYFGAAIDGNCASPTIERNIFSYNCNTLTSDAVHFGNCSSPTIVNNIFENNQCRALVVTLPEGHTPLIINNTFVGNTVAVHVWRLVSQATHTYRNNILVNNGIGLEAEDGSAVDNPIWQNNLVFGNSTNYLGIADQTGLNSNISVDPLFVAPDDYHLSVGSPAIDSGSATDAPSNDFDGTSRPQDGDASGTAEFDIGAFEFSPP